MTSRIEKVAQRLDGRSFRRQDKLINEAAAMLRECEALLRGIEWDYGISHAVLHGKDCAKNDVGDDTCPTGDYLKRIRALLE